MTTVTIPLTRGYSAVIDAVDADLAQFKWTTKVTTTGGVYATRSTRVNGVRTDVLMHRIILSRMLGMELERKQLTDHEDHDGLNNRRKNLRLATYAQNCQNTSISKNNKSGVIGVCWYDEVQRWRAFICVNNKTRYLGSFVDIADAIRARREAEQTYYGEFAPPPAPNEADIVQRETSRPRIHKHRYADAAMRSDNRSGYKGVWLTGARKKPFAADCAGKHLGTFATAEEAYAVYCAAFAEHYGREPEPQHAD